MVSFILWLVIATTLINSRHIRVKRPERSQSTNSPPPPHNFLGEGRSFYPQINTQLNTRSLKQLRKEVPSLPKTLQATSTLGLGWPWT